MKRNFTVVICIITMYIFCLNAEKKEFEHSTIYKLNQLDTADTARLMTLLETQKHYTKIISEFLENNDTIKKLSYTSNDFQTLVGALITIRTVSENITSSTATFTTKVSIDTEIYSTYFTKVKNFPDTFVYFQDISKNNKNLLKKLEDMITSSQTIHDANEMMNLRTEYSTLLKSINSNFKLISAISLYMGQDTTRFHEFINNNFSDTTSFPWIDYVTAMLYIQNRDMINAEKHFNNLKKSTHSDILLPYYRALTEAKLTSISRDQTKTNTFFDLAIKSNPKASEIYFHRAIFYQSTNKPQLASKDYEVFLKTSPMSADALYQYGLVLFQLMRDKDARNAMQKASRYGHTQATQWLKQTHSSQKRTAPAER